MKRLVFVLLAVLLSLLTVLAGGRAPLAAAQSGPTASTSSLENQAPVEVPSLRTRYSRTYQVGDQYHAHITVAPQNYQAADGSWQPISDTLVPATTAGFAYQNQADDPSVLLPSTLATGPVRLDDGSSWVSFVLTGHSSLSNTASLNGSTATYAIPTGSITETASPSGLTEALTLSNATAPSIYTWNLATSSDLTAQTNVSGGIDFLNSADQVVLTMPAPVMTDAAGNSSFNVHLSLSQDSLGETLTLTADSAWLADPSRAYPVTIDPSTYVAPLTQGCTLNESTPTTSQCTTGPYVISGGTGTEPEGSQIPSNSNAENTLLQFNLSGIPSNMQILDTTLGLHVTAETIANAPANVQLHAVTRSWTTSATWNTDSGSTAWTNPGGDYATTPVCNTPISGTPPNWLLLSCNAIVQNWVNGTMVNNGFAVLTYVNDSITIDSPTTSSTNEPYLDVAYTPWYGAPGQFTVDGGVNVFNGNLVLGSTDLAMTGIGLPLTLSRVYNGLSAGNPGPFGNGWSIAGRPNGYLYIFSDGNITYYAPDGSRWPFQMVQTVANGETVTSYLAPPGIDADLVNTGSNAYTLTFHASQEVLHFTGNQLTSDVDRSGNTISYVYDSSGRLTTITDTQGRTTTFSYTSPVSSSLISQITDPAGRTYQYGYNSNQNLTSYIDPNNKTTQYSYDTMHNDELTQITDPDGNVVQFTYYGSEKVDTITQVNTTPGSANPVTTFTYNSGNTVVTDPNNHQTTYTYDPLGRVTAIKDARGNTAQMSWTSDNQVASTTPPSGHTTTYTYDASNRLTNVTLPTSPAVGYSWVYGSSSFPYQPTTFTDERGNTTTYGYNSQGLLNSVTDANNHSVSTVYNGNGTVQSETDADNNTTSYSYYSSGTDIGLLSTITLPFPLGSESITYDSANRVHVVSQGTGNTTTTTYDPLDRPTAVSYSDGGALSYTYDADGNVLDMTDGTGTTSYTYNSLGQRTSTTLPAGPYFTATIDGSNLQVSEADTYDPAGNLLTKQDAAGTTAYTYDPDNNVGSVKDRLGATTQLGYNQDDGLTSYQFPNGVTESMSYTPLGELNAISAVNSSLATLTSYTYNYTDPSTSKPTTMPFGVTDVNNTTTSFTYSPVDLLSSSVEKSSGGGTLHSYSYGYDNAGNLTSEQADSSPSTTLTYNAAGELTTASGNLNKTYSYDKNGNLTQTCAPSGCSTPTLNMGYNAQNQMTSIAVNGGTPTAMTYTGAGSSEQVSDGSTTYQYDQSGMSQEYTGGTTIEYTTLPDGTPISESLGSNTYYYLDNGAGSVAGITGSSGTLTDWYQYDPYGNITGSSTPVQNPLTWQYAEYNSSTGLYHGGNGAYYDPTTGNSSGRHGETDGTASPNVSPVSAFAPVTRQAPNCWNGPRNAALPGNAHLCILPPDPASCTLHVAVTKVLQDGQPALHIHARGSCTEPALVYIGFGVSEDGGGLVNAEECEEDTTGEILCGVVYICPDMFATYEVFAALVAIFENGNPEPVMDEKTIKNLNCII